jgi:hypothetical protein
MDKFLKIISSVVDSVTNWITLHPKTALAIVIFVAGFIIGSLF